MAFLCFLNGRLLFDQGNQFFDTSEPKYVLNKMEKIDQFFCHFFATIQSILIIFIADKSNGINSCINLLWQNFQYEFSLHFFLYFVCFRSSEREIFSEYEELLEEIQYF